MTTDNLLAILEALATQHAPPSDLRRIQQLHDLDERSPACLGMALVGSYAKNSGDRISDLDPTLPGCWGPAPILGDDRMRRAGTWA